MTFSASIHHVKHFSASTVAAPDNECSPHLTIDFASEGFSETASGSVTFYIGDPKLVHKLITAINETVRAHKRSTER